MLQSARCGREEAVEAVVVEAWLSAVRLEMDGDEEGVESVSEGGTGVSGWELCFVRRVSNPEESAGVRRFFGLVTSVRRCLA